MKLRTPALALLACAVLVGTALAVSPSRASDHDDGTTDTKTPSLNLTDLYVFMESTQRPAAAADSMILIMNLNGKSLKQTDQFFNSGARYEFHWSRVGDNSKNDTRPTGKDDGTLRFEFTKPDANSVQSITVSAVKDGKEIAPVTRNTNNSVIMTTPWASAANPTKNELTIDGQPLTVFAGLREDPFFFDVNRFFALRAVAAANVGKTVPDPLPTFAPKGDDFTKDTNCLSIVVRVPRAFFQEASGTKSTTFDFWETIMVKK